jgi:hypothetical protein
MITEILATLAAAMTPASDCKPIDGANALIADRSVHWIVMGELHGTAETPSAFGDLVCLAAASRRPIVVVLERPETEQPEIDTYLKSDGGADAQAELTRAPMWHGRFQDGRSSRAYLALIERLRVMAQAQMIAGVIAAQPNKAPPIDAAHYERNMAQMVETAGASSETLALMLVGNIHAMTKPVTPPGSASYIPMAGLLPQAGTRTLNAISNGGAAWNCSGSPMVCAAHTNGYDGKERLRGIVMTSDPASPYSGSFNLGVPSTASPPVIAPKS